MSDHSKAKAVLAEVDAALTSRDTFAISSACKLSNVRVLIEYVRALEAENDQMAGLLDDNRAALIRAEAELDELRKALERIAVYRSHSMHDAFENSAAMAEIARATLSRMYGGQVNEDHR